MFHYPVRDCLANVGIGDVRGCAPIHHVLQACVGYLNPRVRVSADS